MGRYSVTIHTDVDVPIDYVLDELSDKELLAELKSRNITVSAPRDASDELQEVYNLILRGNANEALTVLHKIIYPRFKSIEHCQSLFSKTAMNT